MRFGNWRGVTLALGLAFALTASARAQDFHTIPRLVPAVDVNTGGPYYAPPVPYGHYAGKNLGGKLSGHVHGLFAKVGGLGHGLGHGAGCGSCGGKGCGLCGGGLGHGGCGDPGCGDAGCGGLLGKHKLKGFGGCGLCGGLGCGSCLGHVVPSAQSVPVVMPAPQGVPAACDPCGGKGCGLFGKHGHLKGCGLCGGKGCGSCATGGDACGGKGCGLCGGLGRHGLGLGAKAHGLLGHLTGANKIKWFVGPGGPVPLTPGYTPYINVTRSPRDFFAFPPMTP